MSIPGAALGGAAGESAQQLINRASGNKSPETSTEAAIKIGTEGAKQGAYELGGKIGGKIVGAAVAPAVRAAAGKYPVLASLLPKGGSKAVGHLTAAASPKGSAGPALKAIEGSIENIEQELTKLPRNQRTAQAFLDSVSNARKVIHDEYGAALFPHANEPIDVMPIANEIQSLKKEWMNIPSMGKEELAELDKAATTFQQPMTVGQLDSLRQQLNSDLSSLFSATPNAKYTAVHKDINKAIDDAIVRKSRDILYPVADRSAGKPAGYFSTQLERESNLITLRGVLQKRLDDLAGSQAISEVTPRLSSENISLSAHPGTMPRAGVYGVKNALSPPREMNMASSHVKKAFDLQLSSLPYEMLLANMPRAMELMSSHDTPEKKKVADFLKP
jgi:hypothetical protein